MGTIPGAGVEVKEPDEYTEFHPLDPSISSPLVAWLASDEAAHVTGSGVARHRRDHRAVGRLALRPDDLQRRPRWDATTLGAQIATDIFRSRAPGLRPG